MYLHLYNFIKYASIIYIGQFMDFFAKCLWELGLFFFSNNAQGIPDFDRAPLGGLKSPLGRRGIGDSHIGVNNKIQIN